MLELHVFKGPARPVEVGVVMLPAVCTCLELENKALNRLCN